MWGAGLDTSVKSGAPRVGLGKQGDEVRLWDGLKRLDCGRVDAWPSLCGGRGARQRFGRPRRPWSWSPRGTATGTADGEAVEPVVNALGQPRKLLVGLLLDTIEHVGGNSYKFLFTGTKKSHLVLP